MGVSEFWGVAGSSTKLQHSGFGLIARRQGLGGRVEKSFPGPWRTSFRGCAAQVCQARRVHNGV